MEEQVPPNPPHASGPQASAPYPPPPYPPPYGYYDPRFSYQAPEARTSLEKLNWKQKLILIGALVVLVLVFAAWNSCHPAAAATSSNRIQKQQPGLFPANPLTIESQREQAQRDLDQAKADATAAKQRLESGPSAVGNPQESQSVARAGAPQQDPDAQFWHQVRQENWKREHDAPYASGVGFVTRAPRAAGSEDNTAFLNHDSNKLSAPSSNPTSAAPEADKSQAGSSSAPAKYPLDQTDGLGPLHRLEEGTILPATLLNQLDGEFTGPVLTQLSENVYDASGLNLLIPAGSKILGEAHSVNSNNQRRLAVSFHRITMTDGYPLSLNKFPGLAQTGASALSGSVNNHLLQTFGMAAAVGAISGLAQIGNSGTAALNSPFYGFREGVSQQTALSSEQILNRYLNRYPTITIKPGTRVKVILLADIPDVPEFAHHQVPVNR